MTWPVAGEPRPSDRKWRHDGHDGNDGNDGNGGHGGNDGNSRRVGVGVGNEEAESTEGGSGRKAPAGAPQPRAAPGTVGAKPYSCRSPRADSLLRLQVYILRRLAASLLLVVLVVSTVLFIGQTVRVLERVPDVGVGFVLSLLPLLLPMTLAITLPFSFLVSTVLTYGRLSDDNEVIAMRMAGIHPWAVAAPGVFAGAVLSFFCLGLWGNLAPAAVAAQDDLRGDVYRRFLELVQHSEKSSFTGRDVKVSWSGVEGGDLIGLHISRSAAGSDGALEIHAERGGLRRDPTGRVLVFDLRDFVWTTFGEGRASSSRGGGISFAVAATDLFDVQGTIYKSRALDGDELLFRAFRQDVKSEHYNVMMREFLGRVSIALAPLCFALCGIPLALLVGKRSRAAAAVLAFGVAAVFFLVWQASDALAASGTLPIAAAKFAANVLLVGAGAVLLRMAVHR